MKQYRFKSLVIMSLAALTIYAANDKKQSILSLKESITDNDIVFPASFETDTKAMMENWYLQNYAILDKDVENKNVGEVDDAEYIRRLKAIPSSIELPYNQVVRSYIDRYVKRNRTLVEQMLGMSLYYMPIFEQALEKEGLPLELRYIPVIESAMNPNAVSPAGAAGLWQFMLGTARGVGLEVNSLVDERRDPYRSSEKAAAYFKQLHDIYGDWSLAIAAYNCGPGNVNKAIRRASNPEKPDFWEIYNYLPRETRGYVPAFIAANYIMTYFKEHNISPSLARKPLIVDTVSVNRRIHFRQISQVLNIPIEEIRILNPQYRHDVIPGNTHPYSLALPSQQVYSFIMVEDSIAQFRNDLYANRDVVEPGTSSSNYANASEYYDEIKVENSTPSSSSSRSNSDYYDEIKVENTRPASSQSSSSMVAQNNKRSNADYYDEIKVETTPGRESSASSSYQGSYTIDDESTIKAGDTYKYEKKETKPAPKPKTKEEVAAAKRSRYKINDTEQASAKNNGKKAAAQAKEEKKDNGSTNKKNAKNSKQKAEDDTKGGKKGKKGKKETKPEETKPVEHEIKRGESLDKIAKKNGVTVEELRKANNIKGDKIEAGDKIKIPTKSDKKAEPENKSGKGKHKKGSNDNKDDNKSSGSKKSSKKKRK
ncbi:MAG: transglycosylase SLT domain-containing protein [Muribaculaceae bacterium]|nr:transglycosylase SLT domain-containing protein [Muribaculaceae bacterium]